MLPAANQNQLPRQILSGGSRSLLKQSHCCLIFLLHSNHRQDAHTHIDVCTRNSHKSANPSHYYPSHFISAPSLLLHFDVLLWQLKTHPHDDDDNDYCGYGNGNCMMTMEA